MDLKTYLSQKRGRQAALAKALNAHAPDVSCWADGKRPIPAKYGARIESATGGAVTRQEMFPTSWATFWPELARQRRTSPAGRLPTTPATDPAPAAGHAGRQPPATNNMLDTVPDHAAVVTPGENA